MAARNRVPGDIVSRAMMLSRAPRSLPLRMRLRARLIRLVMLLSVLVVAGGVAACSPAGGGPALPSSGPLVTVSMRGGLCPEGPCDSAVILERDGRVHSDAKPPNELGLVPAAAMASLNEAISATDWAALKSKPFTGECPIAFDGQEQVFEFAVGTETQRLASCEVEIDWTHPLFMAVASSLGEWIQIPLF